MVCRRATATRQTTPASAIMRVVERKRVLAIIEQVEYNEPRTRRRGRRLLLALPRCSSSRSPLGSGTGYERGTLCVRGDVSLWVALQASLMAERFADGAGDADCRIGVSELVGASHVSEHAADGDLGLCRAGCSSCRR